MTLEEALQEIERRDETINSYKTILGIERENLAELLGTCESLTCQVVDLEIELGEYKFENAAMRGQLNALEDAEKAKIEESICS